MRHLRRNTAEWREERIQLPQFPPKTTFSKREHQESKAAKKISIENNVTNKCQEFVWFLDFFPGLTHFLGVKLFFNQFQPSICFSFVYDRFPMFWDAPSFHYKRPRLILNPDSAANSTEAWQINFSLLPSQMYLFFGRGFDGGVA